jgi:CheY-like chemotaxis protein
VALRILVVDDSERFRDTAATLLAIRGFELLASVGQEAAALCAVRRSCPDGALVDVNLPHGDGLTLSAALVAICPGARIVLTSADLPDVSPDQLSRCRAVAFVRKDRLAVADLATLFGGARDLHDGPAS